MRLAPQTAPVGTRGLHVVFGRLQTEAFKVVSASSFRLSHDPPPLQSAAVTHSLKHRLSELPPMQTSPGKQSSERLGVPMLLGVHPSPIPFCLSNAMHPIFAATVRGAPDWFRAVHFSSEQHPV